MLSMTADRWIAVVSLAVTIAAVLFSIWAYKRGEKQRIPTVITSPQPEALVKPILSKLDGFDVSYRGERVGKEGITAFFIYFWNAGQLPVRHSDVLAPYGVRLPANARVLNLSVVKTTRAILGIDAQLQQSSEGDLIKMNFAVLEPGDGLKLQVVIDGPPETNLSFEGSCIGSPKLRVLPPDWVYFTERRKRFQQTTQYFSAVFSAWLGLGLVSGLVVLITNHLPSSSKYIAILLIAAVAVSLSLAIWSVLRDWYRKLTGASVPPEIRPD